MLQIIDYVLVCGFLLFIMKGFDRILLTYAVFSNDLLPGVELVIEASDSISCDEEEQAIEKAHRRNHQVKRTSDEGRRSYRVARVTAIGFLILSIIIALIFPSEVLLKTILGCGIGMVLLSLAVMLFKYGKVAHQIDLMTQNQSQ